MPRVLAAGTIVLACALLVGRRRLPAALATAACLVIVAAGLAGGRRRGPRHPARVIFAGCYALGRHAGTVPGVIGLVDARRGGPRGIGVDDARRPGRALGRPADRRTLAVRPTGPFARTGQRGLAAQGRRLVEEQRELAQRAVADERRRIARELHDVIAHSLSVMVVQAGAAASALRTDPDTTERGLEEVQRAGRSALAETGRLLHLLRDTEEADLAPQPSAAQLPELVEVFRAAGLDVDLVSTARPRASRPASICRSTGSCRRA